MARPKSTTPPKGKINLSVSQQTKAELTFISQHTGISVSELLATWASKEAKRISKQIGVDIPDPDQLSIDDL